MRAFWIILSLLAVGGAAQRGRGRAPAAARGSGPTPRTGPTAREEGRAAVLLAADRVQRGVDRQIARDPRVRGQPRQQSGELFPAGIKAQIFRKVSNTSKHSSRYWTSLATIKT